MTGAGAASRPTLTGRLRSALSRRAVAWSRRRSGADTGVIVLVPRRVYILPTRLGLVYAAMLFTMLLAGLNYANNLALVLTFVLTAIGWVAMQECHRNLVGLSVRAGEPRAAFAGEPAALTLHLSEAAGRARHDLVASAPDGDHEAITSLPARGSSAATLELPTRVRGRRAIGRVKLESRFPLGLCRAWTWLHLDTSVVVYARPGPPTPPPAGEDGPPGAGPARELAGEEDVSGLRDYRPGDPPGRIAWKVLARGGDLTVREMSREASAPLSFDWDAVPANDLEERISRLTRLVVEAAARGEAYGLTMPGGLVPIGRGHAHRHACLAMLALYRAPTGPDSP